MTHSPAAAPSSRKALQHTLTFIQFAGMVALLAWAMLLKRDLSSAEQQIAELRQRLAPSGNFKMENQALRVRVADLESKLATAQAEAAAPKPIAATVAVPVAPANPMAALAATMNNPAMRAMMATSQKRMLEKRFADLFTQFQFTPEQRSRFLELMTDGLSLSTESAMKLASGNLSPAEQAAIREKLKDQGEVTDLKVREFLGDDAKFTAYKQYTEQQSERSQVNALKASLAQSGQASLSAEQSAALTSIMYEERKGFASSRLVNRETVNPMAVPTAEAMEIRVREQEQLNSQIANRAASVLTPEQLGSLRQEQANRVDALRASAEMARQLLGGAQPATK